jgi:hypothetical protein
MSPVVRRSLTLLSCAVFVSLTVAPPAGQGRGLGKGQPGSAGRKARGDIAAPIPGALNGSAAVAALGGELGRRVRERGGSPEEYAALLAGDESAWISDQGQLMFVDVVEHNLDADGNPIPDEVPTPTGPAPTPLSLLPNGMPVHHSKPGAPWTIYLDVDGESPISINAWGIFNRTITALTIDADTSTFNVDEQAVISRMWGRAAEDWAPFNVDVTTERPDSIGPTVLWSVIGKSPSELGFPPNVGGVAQFSFGYMPFGLETPTFTFWESFGATDHSTIADVIAQEGGHMFGLLHDGLFAPTGGIIEYYGGHGTGPTSWGPVMGAPLARNVTQWSRGEYPGAVNPFYGPWPTQDDIAIIAGKLGFRADDFANTISGAGLLAQPTAGFITSPTDVDVFALPLANDVHIEITPFRAGELTDGGNLDVAADILNAAGVVVATVDDVSETAAALTADLPSTPHFLRVRPSFDAANYPAYASLGGYTVSGTFVRTVKLVEFQEPLATSVLTPGRVIPVKFTLTNAVASARVQLRRSPVGALEDALAETSCNGQPLGRQHCILKVPPTLEPGSYWIVAQFQNIDGSWVTAGPISGGTENPFPVVVN